ncbi:MAG: hypothetical protein HY298_05040 [Verrucomicrobia bacterium]|nr:hypothetical protein [Verrucomicrobiota bacterium]
MTLEKTWAASSLEQSETKNTDLSKLAGKWSAHVRVTISNPVVVQQGPVEQHLHINSQVVSHPYKQPA